MPELPTKTGIPSRAVTLDALHTTKKPDAALVEDHGASCFPTVKGNRPTLHAELEAVDREAEGIGRHREESSAAHGRIGSRWIAAIGDPALLQAFPGCRQAFRVTRFHRTAGTGKVGTTVACGVTSLSPEKVDPRDLSKLNKARRVIETRSRCRRDADFGDDASRMRTGHGTVNSSAVTKPALAIILRDGCEHAPNAFREFSARPKAVLDDVMALPDRAGTDGRPTPSGRQREP